MFHFYISWECLKTFGFLTLSGGIEMEHWVNVKWLYLKSKVSGAFRTPSMIYDGAFIQKQSAVLTVIYFWSSIVESRLGPKYISKANDKKLLHAVRDYLFGANAIFSGKLIFPIPCYVMYVKCLPSLQLHVQSWQ